MPEAPRLPARRHGQSGLVLLALMIMLVLVGVGALGAAEIWATTLKREREAELLFIGDQYRRAVASYWKMSPGRRAFPPSIESLLTDERFPNPVHHLRRAYRDPMTESGEFELLKQGNGLVGVHTTSDGAPIKHAGFAVVYKPFEQAEHYSQWQFIFSPTGAGVAVIPTIGQNPQQPPTFSPQQGPAPGVTLPQVPSGRSMP